jgi:hypothetical protein
VPITITIENLLADFDRYESQLIKLEGVNFLADATFGTGAAANLTIEQNSDQMIARNHFGTFTNFAVKAASTYNITGFAIPFRDDRQIAPRATSDFVEFGHGADPVLTVTGSGAFGNVAIGDSLTKTFIVVGANLPTNIQMEITGADASQFRVEQQNDEYDPYTGGDFEITFKPTSTGSKTATLRVWSGDTIRTLTLTGSSATSIVNEIENNVVLYPNPVKDVLYIQAEQTIAKIEIYSMSGQIVVQQFGDNNSINVMALPKGTYIVRITFADGTMLPRVIVK